MVDAPPARHTARTRTLLIALALLLALLVLSGTRPYDRATWWVEIFPILIVVPVLRALQAHE